MSAKFLTSTKDFRDLNRLFRRRAAKLKIGNSEVHITRAGALHRARLAGHPDSVLAATPEEAVQRLRTLLASKPAHCGLKHADRDAERKERQAERDVERAFAKSVKKRRC
jgi:hypothetical protein